MSRPKFITYTIREVVTYQRTCKVYNDDPEGSAEDDWINNGNPIDDFKEVEEREVIDYDDARADAGLSD